MFFKGNKLEFLVASRGHHADVGGATPGSMPPFSTKLSEEGVAIESFKILKKGVYDEEGLVKILKEGKSRKIEDNLNDLRASCSQRARDSIDSRVNAGFWDKRNERIHAFRANERRTSRP